jgi:hypothetical protein
VRTHFLTVGFALLFAMPAYGQVSYGLKAGVNFADLSFDSSEDVATSTRIGVLAGGFATVRLGWLALQPEAIYTIKGASLDIGDIDSEFIVDYLEVPVLARLALPRALYVAAGPSVALRLRARSRTAFGGSTEEIDLDDEVERVDLGIVGAVGLELGRWAIDGRYTHGLSDSDTDTSDIVSVRNRVFSLSLGIRF